jgi:hypothetical protein
MIEQGGAVGPPPSVSRTVGQGIWERQSPGIFKSLFKFFTFDATGQNLARLEVEELVEFQSRDQVDLHAVAAVFAPSGIQVGTNCLVGSGTRLGFPE